jgi:hypothetical protein
VLEFEKCDVRVCSRSGYHRCRSIRLPTAHDRVEEESKTNQNLLGPVTDEMNIPLNVSEASRRPGQTAVPNAPSESVIEPLRLIVLPQLEVMIDHTWITWVWYEDARDDRRETSEVLLWRSDISGNVLRGGTQTIERDPLLLSMERIVRIDLVGERVMEAESDTMIGG